MALNPVLVAAAEEGEGADTRGGKELDCEDGVDLADELVANVDGSFSYRAAKLRYVLVSVPRDSHSLPILRGVVYEVYKP